MRISQETIAEKLKVVPETVSAQVTSDEVASTLSSIAQKHGLHIDQAGLLDEETLYVMLGLEDAEGFVGRVSSRIGIPEDQATSIVQEINDRVFRSIRNSLQKPPEREGFVQDEAGSKESILAEIENPTPTIHPISAADQTIPGPAVQREVIADAPKPVQAIAPAPQDFLSSKLTQAQNTPTQKVKYAADPYREPIN